MVGNWLPRKQGDYEMGKKGYGTLVRNSSGMWSVRTVQDGKITIKSTGTKNKKEAQAFQRKLAKDRMGTEGKTLQEKINYHRQMLEYYISLKNEKKVALDDMFSSFCEHPDEANLSKKTLQTYREIVRQFVIFIKENYKAVKDVSQITAEMVNAWIASKKDNAPKTINLAVVTIKRILKVHGNSLMGITKTSGRIVVNQKRAFTLEEMKRILKSAENAGTDMEILFKLSFYTGMRKSDACLLKWENISFENGVITYLPHKTKKNGQLVQVSIHPQLLAFLQTLEKGEPSEYLSNWNAKSYESNSRHLSRKMAKVLVDAGVRGKDDKRKVTFHAIRHTVASIAAEHISQFALQQMLGHSDISMTSKYYHTNVGEVGEKLNQFMAIKF